MMNKRFLAGFRGPGRVVLMLGAAFLPCAAARGSEGSDWPAFRGPDRLGTSATAAAPTHWGPNEGMRWKTAVPGSGNSSPIVVGDQVIVTTAYPATQREFAKQSYSYGLTLLALLVGLSAIRILVRSSALQPPDSGGMARMVSLAAFAAAAFMVLFFLFFGPSAIDYERCLIRAWLGSSILVGLCVLMMEISTPPGSKWRVIVGIGSLLFAVVVFVFTPAKEHAFRGGYFGASAATVWASALLPFLGGMAALMNHFVLRPRPAATEPAPDPSSRRRIATVLYSLIGLAGVGVSALVGALIVRQRPAPGEETTWGPREVPVDELAIWVAGSLPIIIGLVALMMSGLRRPQESDVRRGFKPALARLIGTLALAGGGFALVIAALSKLIAQSPFLTYHLARPDWNPTSGWTMLWVCAGAMTLYFLVEIVRLRNPARIRRIAPIGFRLLLLTVAVAAWVRVNAVSNQMAYTRALVCLDRKTGEIKWTCEGLVGPEGQLHKINSPATPTAVVHDGKVFAFFGYGGLMASDLSGKLLWENPNVQFKSIYGVGVSPIAYGDNVIVVNAQPKSPKLMALNTKTGKLTWEVGMPETGKFYPSGNSRTPIIREINGKQTLLVWDFAGLSGHDPVTGERYWHYEIGNGGEGDMVASLVDDGERLYCSGPLRTIAMDLSKLGKSMDVEEVQAWNTRAGGANCSSPVLCEGRLFFVTDMGKATCLDAKTGERVWRDRLDGRYYASPVAVGKHVYFTNDEGKTTILDATQDDLVKVAENDMEAATYASFALLPEGFIGRTEEEVFALAPGASLVKASK